ncbi:PP2C family protein-serine/threonine phosphatase [Thermocatellispora tengchongensis]|uniref:PP2C family protein-serine/threonine phosphatase n=1 Tax=Thermocatellispora tengchongensis TaxID=1073253 RepID=UPI0036307545
MPTPTVIGFAPGDQILFYTDGIIEARDHGGAFYPLTDRVHLLAGPDPQAALDSLRADVLRHSGRPLSDDAAMLLLRRTEHEPAENGEPGLDGERAAALVRPQLSEADTDTPRKPDGTDGCPSAAAITTTRPGPPLPAVTLTTPDPATLWPSAVPEQDRCGTAHHSAVTPGLDPQGSGPVRPVPARASGPPAPPPARS